MIGKLKSNYGALFEPALISEIESTGHLKKVESGTHLMHIGQYIKSMPLVLTGILKIMREYQEDDSAFSLLFRARRNLRNDPKLLPRKPEK
tara:strand:- start:5195 stop:5467 length:273 start_codon:yes stop_codon:yes gene_type:complete